MRNLSVFSVVQPEIQQRAENPDTAVSVHRDRTLRFIRHQGQDCINVVEMLGFNIGAARFSADIQNFASGRQQPVVFHLGDFVDGKA